MGLRLPRAMGDVFMKQPMQLLVHSKGVGPAGNASRQANRRATGAARSASAAAGCGARGSLVAALGKMLSSAAAFRQRNDRNANTRGGP